MVQQARQVLKGLSVQLGRKATLVAHRLITHFQRAQPTLIPAPAF
jgi:hypothetical protein